MLTCQSEKSMMITDVERKDSLLFLKTKEGMLRLQPLSERCVRVTYTERSAFFENENCGILPLGEYDKWTFSQNDTFINVSLGELDLHIDCNTCSISYLDKNGKILFAEKKETSKELDEFPVYRIDEGSAVKTQIDTADGKKELIRDAARIQTGTAYHTRYHFCLDEAEDLYGLGQHEEGFSSLRGKRIYLHQANRKIAIPMFVSTKGYGILFNTGSPAVFNDNEDGTYFYSEADPQMDFFFMNGGTPDGVIRQYRSLTGKAVMLPKWAFGYIQSQERYETQAEIISVAEEYRKRDIGLDCVVLDWFSWPEGQWGQKTFDADRFPDPSAMISDLHDSHVHFMISVWPNTEADTVNGREFEAKGEFLPGVHIYNAFMKEARETYWKQLTQGLFCHGVDAWWCDNSEPVTPEWNYMVRPENSRMYEDYCRIVADHIPAEKTNTFGYYHAQGIYEGQRAYYSDKPTEKRVINLTRNTYTGGQKFGVILWSGDIEATWDTLRKQIAAGLNFCASGFPYWTVDIGAFFVKRGAQWYWKGDYDLGAEDPAYCELFTRWYEWGAFLPVFRGHGTDVRRELWNFDRPEAPFYDALVKTNHLRYRLMPYIYSLAGMVWLKDRLMMRPLSFMFPDDEKLRTVFDQYMFGDELMICPVTEPMFFEHKGHGQKGESIKDVSTFRKVILPENTSWYDLYTEKYYEGGQCINADVPLDHIPVFVKAGSIIPETDFACSTEEQTGPVTITVYPGADGCFTLYEDAGDGYAYEKGDYKLTELRWSDQEKTLYVNGQINDSYKVRIAGE